MVFVVVLFVIATLDFWLTVENISMSADLPYSGTPKLSIKIFFPWWYPDFVSKHGLPPPRFTVSLYQQSDDVETKSEYLGIHPPSLDLKFVFDPLRFNLDASYTILVTREVENGPTTTLKFTDNR